MKTSIYSLKGEQKGEIELPNNFQEEIRPDIIKRAVDSSQANKRQPYGPSSDSGMRHATSSPEKGRGISRVQRMTQYRNRAAETPNNVGGRRAHPPKPEEKMGKKINKKERTKARRSALAATSKKRLVRGRGHRFDDKEINLPIVVEKGAEDIEKTKEAIELLRELGVYSDVKKAKEGKTIRAGKGKSRNRRYRMPTSILVVLPDGCSGIDAFSNLPGVDVKTPDTVTIEDLAPGGDMGRLTMFSVKALNMTGDW